ncbi:MAG TPA: hypothetical protein VKT75_13145 [Acidobacteriaceae bacterium]|nr:hypothetical protein [Acidobacteriaceae bacterium]
MRILILVACSILLITTSHAQISQKEITFVGMIDCIKEATTTNSIEDNGEVLILSCNTGKAKVLFNFLGRKVRSEVVQDKNGKFENRPFGNNACYHRIEDAAGKTTDDFRCDLVLVVGDILTD